MALVVHWNCELVLGFLFFSYWGVGGGVYKKSKTEMTASVQGGWGGWGLFFLLFSSFIFSFLRGGGGRGVKIGKDTFAIFFF